MLHGFGKRLREVRRRKGLTQDEVATKVTCSKNDISRYEREGVKPSVQFVAHFCQCLNISPTWLIFASGDMDLNPTTRDIIKQKIIQNDGVIVGHDNNGHIHIEVNKGDFDHGEDISKLIALLKYAPSEFINNVINRLESFKSNSKI